MAIYTCVLLDVDNTILDFDAAERQALTDMLAEYELPHDEAAYDTYTRSTASCGTRWPKAS